MEHNIDPFDLPPMEPDVAKRIIENNREFLTPSFDFENMIRHIREQEGKWIQVYTFDSLTEFHLTKANSRTVASHFKRHGGRIGVASLKSAVAGVRHPIYRKVKYQRRSMAVRNFLATRGVDLRLKY